MNTKNNSRRRASVERIERAFMEQLQEKELPQIKVSDICKEAQVNRSTFYAGYEDIFDLALKIQTRLEEEVNRLFDEEVLTQLQGGDFLKFFYHIRENQELYRFYFKLGRESSSRLKLYDVCVLGPDAPQEHLDYHILFFKEGFNALIKRWLETDCRESPEQMRDILLWEYQGRWR